MIDYIDFGHALRKCRRLTSSCVSDLSGAGYVQLCNLLAKVFAELELWSEFDEGVFLEACEVVGENGVYESIARKAKSVVVAHEIVEAEKKAILFEIDGIRVKVFPKRVVTGWRPGL